MRIWLGGVAILTIAHVSLATPQETSSPAATTSALATRAQGFGSEAEKTLKERLSDKASDEQRVDNCGISVDRRGPKWRPDCDASGVGMKRLGTPRNR